MNAIAGSPFLQENPGRYFAPCKTCIHYVHVENRINRMFQDVHDCMDAEGRATQEAKAEDISKYYIQIHTFILKKSLA